MHYFLGMEVWQNVDGISLVRGKYATTDPEEVQDDGMQGHDHTYGIKLEAIECCFIRVGWYHDVSSYNLFLDIPDGYKNRYFLYYEHIETCSLDCCKACSEVPKGYSWLRAEVWCDQKINLEGYVN